MTFKYFGTDGIRGKANKSLTPEIAYKVGRYLGYKLNDDEHRSFLIGRDTRLSGQMLEASLAAGLMASGCNVDVLGVVVTPLVAHILKEEDYVGGIMISASHNPFYDNGLKIMNHDGLKIDEFLQTEIEDYLDGKIKIPYRVEDGIGKLQHRTDLIEAYKNYLKQSIPADFSNVKIAVDAAFGSTSELAHMFEDLNMTVDVINDQPDGLNINEKCGSTHPKHLQDFMKDKDYDLGVAYDGDGDRLIFIDEKNNIVDGDGIMYMLANHYKKHGSLNEDTIVVTVMSNLGLLKALQRDGIQYVITDVGDKNVFEKMEHDNYIVGGEQSGHIIIKEHSNMGDGLLVTLKILSIMIENDASMSQLLEGLKIYPQLLKNTLVKDKDSVLGHDKLDEAIREVTEQLGDNGRILVRASGTEPLIRVMVEAETEILCEQYVDRILECIKQIEA